MKHSLVVGLQQAWPHYLSFLISFIVLGTIWINHHEMSRFIKRSDHYFLLINVTFLMTVILIPFPTAVLARHLHTQQEVATILYTGTFFILAAMYNVIWFYALKMGLVYTEYNDEVLKIMSRGNLIAATAFFIAFVLSFFWYKVSLLLDLLIYLVYLLPTPTRQVCISVKKYRSIMND